MQVTKQWHAQANRNLKIAIIRSQLSSIISLFLRKVKKANPKNNN